MELGGRRALVTGASSGIGRETAILLARQGAEIVAAGGTAETGPALVADIRDRGGSARFLRADLADLDSVHALADEAGDGDIMVNNAGAFPFAPNLEQTVDDSSCSSTPTCAARSSSRRRCCRR